MSYRHPLAQLLWGTVTTHTAPVWHRAPAAGGGPCFTFLVIVHPSHCFF